MTKARTEMEVLTMRRIVVLLLIASLSASIAATSAEAAKRKKPKQIGRAHV